MSLFAKKLYHLVRPVAIAGILAFILIKLLSIKPILFAVSIWLSCGLVVAYWKMLREGKEMRSSWIELRDFFLYRWTYVACFDLLLPFLISLPWDRAAIERRLDRVKLCGWLVLTAAAGLIAWWFFTIKWYPPLILGAAYFLVGASIGGLTLVKPNTVWAEHYPVIIGTKAWLHRAYWLYLWPRGLKKEVVEAIKTVL